MPEPCPHNRMRVSVKATTFFSMDVTPGSVTVPNGDDFTVLPWEVFCLDCKAWWMKTRGVIWRASSSDNPIPQSVREAFEKALAKARADVDRLRPAALAASKGLPRFTGNEPAILAFRAAIECEHKLYMQLENNWPSTTEEDDG